MKVFVVIAGDIELGESVNAVFMDEPLAKSHARECAQAQAEEMNLDGDLEYEVVENLGGRRAGVYRKDRQLPDGPIDWYRIEEHPLLIV